MLPNRSFPLITPRARQRFDLRAVLHHLFQRDQPLFAQRRQNLCEQLVQLLLSLHAKIRQRVVVHLLQSRQPLERRIVLATPRHFPRRANPLAVGIHPQADQQLRIERRTPAFFGAALNGFVKCGSAPNAPPTPNRPRGMVLANQLLHIHRPPTHLLPVYKTDQRLLLGWIFLAHAASSTALLSFSRGGFFTASFCKGGVFLQISP